MNWVKAMEDSELDAEGRRIVEIGDRKILVLRHNGRIYAMQSTCPHMGGALVRGTLAGDHEIICPVHRSRFDMETGEVKEWAPWPKIASPVLGVISREHPLPVYPTKVEEGSIWVGLEDAA